MSVHAGFIGVVGLPNAGKSTLVNQVIGEKVSIVSTRPQTTRQRVLGILTENQGQIVFVDAPGLTSRPGPINEFIRTEFAGVLKDSDAFLIVVDMKNDDRNHVEEILSHVRLSKKPFLIALNKKDLVSEEKIEEWKEFLKTISEKVIVVSATQDTDSLKSLLCGELFEFLPKSEKPLYDGELYTTQNTRDMVREIIREKCFEALHQEVPYGLAVRILKFDEDSREDLVKIFAEILVSKDSHKPMVIGRQATMLKEIGQKSREEIEKLLGRKVYINIHVLSRPQWMKNKRVMQEMGYDRNESH